MYLPSHPLYVFIYVKYFCFAVVVMLVVVVGTWRLYFLFVFNCKYLFVHFPLRYLPTSDVNADEDEATFSKGFRFVSFSFSLVKHFRDAHTHTHPGGAVKLLTQTGIRM